LRLVSWDDCQEFIKKLNRNEDSTKYRLPTEAEWEYACRAGTTTAFCSGEIVSEEGFDPNLDKVGWYDQNSEKKTHPVAQKQPNAWGLYDMHGNVWEWCQDLNEDYLLNSVNDLTCSVDAESFHVVRGGSWYGFARYCRSVNRTYYSHDGRTYYLGFRLARTL